MKKRMLGFLSSLFLLIGITGSASAYGLQDWYFDIDGAGGQDAVLISEFFDLVSPNLVDTDYTDGATTYNFVNYGVASFYGHDGGSPFPTDGDYQLNAIYTFYGDADLTDGTNSFTGGTFEIWFDDGSGYDYATAGDAATYYGANDGIKIATFDLVSGEGTINPSGIPNGQLTISYEASEILAGYFFSPDMTDLSTLDPISLTLGFSTTNASWVENPSDTVEAELTDYASYGGVVPNNPPTDFWLSANGQLRIDIVPEPTTMLLFGIGLLGIAGISRRKVS